MGLPAAVADKTARHKGLSLAKGSVTGGEAGGTLGDQHSRTIRVDQEGTGEVRTIMAALALAGPHDTILVEEGTYDEQLMLDGRGPAALQGVGAAEVTLRGLDMARAVLAL